MVNTLFYGIENIKYIYNGDWSDPQIQYKNKIYDYFSVEDTLYDEFTEIKEDDESFQYTFESWLRAFPENVYSLLRQM